MAYTTMTRQDQTGVQMNAKPTHIYVPVNFEPERCLPPILHKYGDCARYFLHRIIWGEILGKSMSDGFVPLKFDYLRAIIPDRILKSLKAALVEAGVIECDGQYIEGRKAFGYRLASPY